MEQLSIRDVAAWTGGRYEGPDLRVSGVSIDSRRVGRGDLFLALRGGHHDGHAFLGVALRDTGDLAGARASLQRAIAVLPPTAAVYVDLGIVYLRGGDLDRALGQLEAGLNLAPPFVPAPDWAAATGALRQALAKRPERADAHHELGVIHTGRGELDLAIEHLERAVELDPGLEAARGDLAAAVERRSRERGAHP